MAVRHSFKATSSFLSTFGSVGLAGNVMLNGETPVKVHVSIGPPSSPGRNEAVIFGPMSNARITIETPAHENTAVALRAGTKVSIDFESTTPVPNDLVAGLKFDSYQFSISRTLEP